MFSDLVARPFIRLARCHIMGRHKPDGKRIRDGFTYRATCTLCHRVIYRRASGHWRLSSSMHVPAPAVDTVMAPVATASGAPPLSRPQDVPQADLHEAARLILGAIVMLQELAPSETCASFAAVHAQAALDVIVHEDARIANPNSHGHESGSWRARLRNSMGVVIGD